MDHSTLIGKTIHFEYANETYQIEIQSADKLKWTRVKGENPGQNDVENYIYSRLSENLIMLTWIEADGLGLTNVLDLVDHKLTTHANFNRDVFENIGRLILEPQ